MFYRLLFQLYKNNTTPSLLIVSNIKLKVVIKGKDKSIVSRAK